MKYPLLLIKALLISAILDAQPVITSSWVPSPGNNFILCGATPGPSSFYLYGDSALGLTGNNVTWDFSQLQLQNNYDTVRYTGATDSLVQTDINQSIVLKLSGNQLLASGLPNLFCGDPFNQVFSAVYYQFPMVDTPVSGSLYSSGSLGSCVDYYDLEYEGWGNLILPNANNIGNVLMIKQVISSSAVQYFTDEDGDGTGVPSTVNSYETDSYQWIIAGVSNPILNINVILNTHIYFDWTGDMDNIKMETIDTTLAIWLYRSSFSTGLSANLTSSGTLLKIYPNPSNNTFILQTNGTGEQRLKIFNLTGQLLMTQAVENSKTIIDARILPPGMYLARLETTDGVAEQKIVIDK